VKDLLLLKQVSYNKPPKIVAKPTGIRIKEHAAWLGHNAYKGLCPLRLEEHGVAFRGLLIAGANLNNSIWTKSDLTGTIFYRCLLKESDFSDTRNATFIECNTRGALFTRATINMSDKKLLEAQEEHYVAQ
jgi:hypothetical protein